MTDEVARWHVAGENGSIQKNTLWHEREMAL